ncbi:hypothetical protein [Streptomyces virginiae]|uniref:hypothetical protein n=1 Tax=Streptomyces virginiae TaxID=1961 RepID=UPI0036BB2A68
MAHRLEDARIRLRLHRFERPIGEGGVGPFRILLVGQHISRLAPAATRLRPERLHRADCSYGVPLRSRIGDVDTDQHVNFIALATWYDEAVAAFASDSIGKL